MSKNVSAKAFVVEVHTFVSNRQYRTVDPPLQPPPLQRHTIVIHAAMDHNMQEKQIEGSSQRLQACTGNCGCRNASIIVEKSVSENSQSLPPVLSVGGARVGWGIGCSFILLEPFQASFFSTCYYS